MLNIIMLSIITLSVIMLNAAMPSVMAPRLHNVHNYLTEAQVIKPNLKLHPATNIRLG